MTNDEATLGMESNLTTLLRNNLGLLAMPLVSFLIRMPSLSVDFAVGNAPFIKGNPYIRDISRLVTNRIHDGSLCIV